jgi:hypothetical protein
MTIWPKITIRAIALGNILMGTMGLFLQVDSVIRFSQRHQFAAARPYETHAYLFMVCIGTVFALLGFLSGFLLWRADRPALRLCNWLFGSELVYWAGGAMVEVLLVTSKSEWDHRAATSIGAVWGIGNMGLAPQLLSLYSVWVLLLLNLAYWRMGKAEASIG